MNITFKEILWIIALVLLAGFTAGYLEEADAQTTGDTMTIGGTTFTAIEITDDEVVWIGDDD